MSEYQFISVPILHLNPIANGVRKTNGISIDNLAASIHAEGLLQNLTVVEEEGQEPTDSAAKTYTVIAGSRRLRALRQLVERKLLPLDYKVPCRVIAETGALTASLAENAIREQMHPADEFTAFREMIDKGHSIEDIAARFGVTPLVVQRRLKLANVAPKLFELFKTGEIKLEQMMALAIVDDHKRQENAWFKANHWERHPDAIRRALTKKEINLSSDPIGQFVGRKAYEEAGGSVHVDLFDDRASGFVTDGKLLQTLAAKKLDAAAELVRREAWSWVEVRPSVDYSEMSKFTVVPASGARKATDVERATIDALTAENDKILKRLEVLGEDDESEEHGELLDRADEIEKELAQIHASLKKWSPNVLAQAGAIVTIEDGLLKIHRGLVKGKLKLAKADKATASKPAATPVAAHSDALMQDLTSRLTHAIGAELVANPGVAIIALTHRLALSVFYPTGAASYDDPIKIGAEQRYSALKTLDAKDCVDVAKLETEHSALKAILPKRATELFSALISPDCRYLTRLLAYCIARTVDATTTSEKTAKFTRTAELAAALQLDMSTRWTPKADDYLKRIHADHIMAALAEANANEIVLADWKKLKKSELAAKADGWLTPANWLPKPFRLGARAAKAK